VQTRRHHPAHLARQADPIAVQDLQQRAFRLHVVVLVLGALQGQDAGLRAAIDVRDLDAPGLPTGRPGLGIEYLVDGCHLA
jgi:hypothetical protein